jgi:hypothetical protein
LRSAAETLMEIPVHMHQTRMRNRNPESKAGLKRQISSTRTSAGIVDAAATPTTRLAIEMMPSFAPCTAARSQPMRWIRWLSR